MARANLGQIVADAWESAQRELPDPFRGDLLWEDLAGIRTTYRERLDRQPYNVYGELIPRLVTVRRNLLRFKARKSGFRAWAERNEP